MTSEARTHGIVRLGCLWWLQRMNSALSNCEPKQRDLTLNWELVLSKILRMPYAYLSLVAFAEEETENELDTSV